MSYLGPAPERAFPHRFLAGAIVFAFAALVTNALSS